MFAPFAVAPSWLTRGDEAAAAAKILASKSLYSLGGAAELIVYVCDIGVALIFYELLKPVRRDLSLLAVFFRLAFVAIASANVLNHFAPLLLMSGAGYLTAFKPDQLRALAVTFIRLHTIGFDIALVFFGFYCVIVGYLFFRSTFFPRILGALLAIAGLCYLTNTFASFLSSAFAASLFPYTLVLGVGGNIIASLAPGDGRERSTMEGAGQCSRNAHMKAAVYRSDREHFSVALRETTVLLSLSSDGLL